MYHNNINFSQTNNSLVIGKQVWIDGKQLPDVPTKSNSITCVQENGKVYINGWEWKNNKWRKTFKAFLKCLFA